MNVFRTVSFIASCVGVVVCIAGMFVTKAFGLKGYPLVFAGNGLLCAIGAWAHWYLDRRLTPSRRGTKKGP